MYNRNQLKGKKLEENLKILISIVSDAQNLIWQKYKFKLNKETSLLMNKIQIILEEAA